MPGSNDRTTRPANPTAPDARPRPADLEPAVEGEGPLKQEGDALLDGSGSRQGRDPNPARDAAPHE